MTYENIRRGIFRARPNRFIAHVELDGKTEICHVKNTGRCKELLVPGAAVFVQEMYSPSRTTKYDLISVYKGSNLVNIDSQVPNKVFGEWVRQSGLVENMTLIRPEYTFKGSRFDFYIEAGGRKILVEIKGVTLEENGIAMFPDAPTLRGLRHVQELQAGIQDGFDTYVVFIIQMKGVHCFAPNDVTHKAFGDALRAAQSAGVQVLALDCSVTECSITAEDFVDIRL